MSKEPEKKSAYDQYVDATVALLMERYYEAMCSKENSDETTEDIPFPSALDEKCRKIIKSEIAKQKRIKFLKRASRLMSTAAVFFLIIIGVFGVLFTTVEAFRVQVINFYVEKNNGYLSIKGGNSPEAPQETGNKEDQICELLEEMLPEEFSLMHQTGSIDTAFNIIFKSTAGQRFVLSVNPVESELQIDTDDLDVLEKIDIMGNEAFFAVKGEVMQLVWVNRGVERLFLLNTDVMNKEALLNIGEAIAEIIQ